MENRKSSMSFRPVLSRYVLLDFCPGNADAEAPESHLPTSTSKPHLSTPSESQPLLSHPSSASGSLPLQSHPLASSASRNLPLQPHPPSASRLQLQPHPSSAAYGSLLLQPHPSSASGLQLQPHPSTAASGSLPLQPHPSSASGRFKRVTDQELSKLAEGLVPQNTAKMTSGALKNFQEWMSNSNVCNPSDPVPEDFLQCTDPVTLNKHLSKFIVETRKSSGELYPPVTLHQLLCGILRYMRRNNPSCPNFLDKKIPGSNVFMGHLTPTSTSCTQMELEDRCSSLK